MLDTCHPLRAALPCSWKHWVLGCACDPGVQQYLSHNKVMMHGKLGSQHWGIIKAAGMKESQSFPFCILKEKNTCPSLGLSLTSFPSYTPKENECKMVVNVNQILAFYIIGVL